MDWSALVASLAHLFGIAFGVGAATVKLALVFRATRNSELVPVLLKVRGTITKFILLGMGLLTASGIYWLSLGYLWSPLLVVKVVIVGVIWVLGPIIDKVVEPRFVKLAPVGGTATIPAFLSAQRAYLAIEACATGLMYAAVIIGASL